MTSEGSARFAQMQRGDLSLWRKTSPKVPFTRLQSNLIVLNTFSCSTGCCYRQTERPKSNCSFWTSRAEGVTGIFRDLGIILPISALKHTL